MDQDFTPPICLVVDDSRVVRKVARRILEGHGYAVEEAQNGQEALTLCRIALPRCVLLDWHMPVMDGLAFLRMLRSEFGPEGPPVLFCTTANELSQIATAIEAGAQGYLMKPFDDPILADKFRSLGLL
jgi:two-component system chemotaxis response regulator CheY